MVGKLGESSTCSDCNNGSGVEAAFVFLSKKLFPSERTLSDEDRPLIESLLGGYPIAQLLREKAGSRRA